MIVIDRQKSSPLYRNDKKNDILYCYLIQAYLVKHGNKTAKFKFIFDSEFVVSHIEH